jgi:N4-gp56 family major capsid protein
MQQYQDPAGGTESAIGTQIRIDSYIKTALIEAKKEMYFGSLADVTSMPKNMGKKIKRYHYVPLLDDANINDQGLDAAGVVGDFQTTIVVSRDDGTVPDVPMSVGVPIDNKVHFVGVAATAALAEDAAIAKVVTWGSQLAVAGGLGLTLTQAVSYDADFAVMVTTGGESAFDLGFRFTQPDGTTITAGAGALEGQSVSDAGNLYGSSKDVGTIAGKMPTLSETGGRVNRVGFTRVELEGTIEKYGFFDEYTKESLDFDTDAELEMHINREMVFGANEITEDLLQIDLLNAAGVVYYAGVAQADTDMSGVDGAVTEVTYGDLSRLSVELDNNRCPKHTKIISGSRMVDTRVIRGGRVMHIGSELTQTVEQMTDYFGNQAFISVAHYADAGTILNGEIGTVGQFRLVVVPEMMHWAGVGADEGVNSGYRASAGKYDVFPMLVVGDASFTTIGFQTNGKTIKFSIKHSKPESPESYANDPYGETGFMSIKWYYGFMSLRPERIGMIKTVAKM